MFQLKKGKKAKRPEGDEQIRRENVRRDLIDFQVPRMCDSYCKFPALIKDAYALEQVCSACPLNKIVDFLEENENGNEY